LYCKFLKIGEIKLVENFLIAILDKIVIIRAHLIKNNKLFINSKLNHKINPKINSKINLLIILLKNLKTQ